MKLYVLRHADATWPGWSQSDDDRPLTAKGREQSRRMAKWLVQMRVAPALIVSSPLPRAFQTAEIVAEQLGIALQEEAALAGGFDLAALRALLTRTQEVDLLIVGHEPDLSGVIAKLTGGRVKMAKAALARIDLASPKSDGTMVWLCSPKMLRC